MASSFDPFSQIQMNYEKLYGIAQQLSSAARPSAETEETFRKIESLYNSSMEELRHLRAGYTEGDGIKSGFEGAFLRATQLDARIDSIYKRICHRYRTFAPTFHLPEERPVAEERRPIQDLRRTSASLISYLAFHGIDLGRCEYRSILGDGNCFYHSIAAYYIDSGQIEGFLRCLTPDLKLAPEHETSLRSFLEEAKRDPEGAIKNIDGMMQFAKALREIAAHEIENHFDQYAPIFRATLANEFDEERKTIEDAPYDFSLINEYVREMGKEASFVPIQALSKALRLPVIIHDTRVGLPTNVGQDGTTAIAPVHMVKSGLHYYLLHLEPARAVPTVSMGGGSAAARVSTPEAERPRPIYRPVTVYYNGPNKLFIRGENGSALQSRSSAAALEEITTLRWDRGIPMNQTGPTTWQLMVTPGAKVKILIDDAVWHEGDNTTVSGPSPIEIYPTFGEATSIGVHADAGIGNRFAICGTGRVRFNDKIIDLSWDPKASIPLTCYAASFWGAQMDVLTPGEFKIIKLLRDGSTVWEKAGNSILSPHSKLDIHSEF